jgi:glycerol uptake facilitator-like aquaporin
MQAANNARRIVAEGIGNSLVLTAVVGSGIMAERLAGGNAAIALLANTVATGAALVFLPALPDKADDVVVPHTEGTQ